MWKNEKKRHQVIAFQKSDLLRGFRPHWKTKHALRWVTHLFRELSFYTEKTQRQESAFFLLFSRKAENFQISNFGWKIRELCEFINLFVDPKSDYGCENCFFYWKNRLKKVIKMFWFWFWMKVYFWFSHTFESFYAA